MSSNPSTASKSWPIQRQIRLAICLFGLVFGLCLPVSVARHIWLDRDLELNGKTVEAQVVALVSCASKTRTIPCYRLRYTIDGNVYQPKNANSSLKLGQTVKLHYAPADPSLHYLSNLGPRQPWDQGISSRLLISCGLGLIFAVSGGLGLRAVWHES
ncbi:MAG: hypothetical protein CVV27_12590 [Candidatus Melainabacteria bacterium HGW-Melainabacteria-1]|nr:MAG: hypothetical protein CVV27_12590 [Candidatus Melainabacteria bacterium HGW-Melainabacteria-1]